MNERLKGNKPEKRTRINLVVNERLMSDVGKLAHDNNTTPSEEVRSALLLRLYLEELKGQGYYLTRAPIEGQITPVIPVENLLR